MTDHSANPADGKLSECERCRDYDRPCPQGCAPVVEPQQPTVAAFTAKHVGRLPLPQQPTYEWHGTGIPMISAGSASAYEQGYTDAEQRIIAIIEDERSFYDVDGEGWKILTDALNRIAAIKEQTDA
jgi:hypothetical protein